MLLKHFNHYVNRSYIASVLGGYLQSLEAVLRRNISDQATGSAIISIYHLHGDSYLLPFFNSLSFPIILRTNSMSLQAAFT